jgi:hypothetical protein
LLPRRVVELLYKFVCTQVRPTRYRCTLTQQDAHIYVERER